MRLVNSFLVYSKFAAKQSKKVKLFGTTTFGIWIFQTRILLSLLVNANMLFSNGMANYLEVITAQSNALHSDHHLTAITSEQISAKIELYRSLGGALN